MIRYLAGASTAVILAAAGAACAQDADPPLRFAAERADGIWMVQDTVMPVGDGLQTLVWTFMREDQTTDDLTWDTRLRHAMIDCDARTLTYVYDGVRRREEYLRGEIIDPETVSTKPGEPEDEVVRLNCQAGATPLITFPEPMAAWNWSADKLGRVVPMDPVAASDEPYVERPRMVLIQADHDWATYYNRASHRSDGERFVDAYALRTAVELPGDDPAWLHARFDCQADTWEALGWFDVDGEGVGARTAEAREAQAIPADGPVAGFVRPMREMACMGQNRFQWAAEHSVEGAIAAAPMEGAQALAQINAPPPPMAEPSGPLDFIGLTGWDEGVFVASSTITRDADRMNGEATLLYVNGRIQHVAEGDIRYSWARQRFDCMSGLIGTDQRDYYGDDNALVSTLGPRAFEAKEASLPWETNLMGYICLEMDPPGMQTVPSRDIAVRGVVDSVAAARGPE